MRLKTSISLFLTLIFLTKMIAMDFQIPLTNLEGVKITMVKSTCPKAHLKALEDQQQQFGDHNYKTFPIEIACPVALQIPEPLFTAFQPTFVYQHYHYKATLRKDGFNSKLSPPPRA